MNEYLEALSKCKLFENFKEDEISLFLNDVRNYIKHFNKGEIIINENDKITFCNIVLKGTALIYLSDSQGNYFLKQQLFTSDDFSHTFALNNSKAKCSVSSLTKSTILYLDINSILSSENPLIARFKNNLIQVLSKKLFETNERLSLLTTKTIREKIIKYLKRFEYQNNKTFTIPFNREQMAEYFAIPRSSLSRELTKLKNEKIIKYNKNKFKVTNIKYFNEFK